MRVLLIGSTLGIGLGVKDLLESENFEVKCTTRKELDIDNFKGYNFKGYDVIILNAYSEYTSQLKLVYNISEQIDKNTLVVVIGSTSAYKSNPTDLYWAKYQNEKMAIISACRDLNSMGYNYSVLSLGTVDTYRNEGKTCLKMSTKQVALEVKKMIEIYNRGLLYEHLVLRPRK